MKVMVTGGLGFKGSVLVPKLIDRGHQVKVVDVGWFGNFLSRSKSLEVLNKSIFKSHTNKLQFF